MNIPRKRDKELVRESKMREGDSYENLANPVQQKREKQEKWKRKNFSDGFFLYSFAKHGHFPKQLSWVFIFIRFSSSSCKLVTIVGLILAAISSPPETSGEQAYVFLHLPFSIVCLFFFFNYCASTGSRVISRAMVLETVSTLMIFQISG